MCEHTVLKNGWDHIDPSAPEIPKPKTPEELLTLKQQRTMWFTGTRCPTCLDMQYTDGVKVWCGNKCNNELLAEKKRRESKEYMGLIKDHF